ncbi:hypothetical protein [Pontibacter burrus]|uniref:Uncharacterized protein n=1 Tax=Pontibacter burrus TaxID=2704466 RepID=A0A6B3LSR1_9BACT|nr:hypothetical protein [Pontibacter burrus]NEM96607.1 hypothetical protein [Pontibacter burrus]
MKKALILFAILFTSVTASFSQTKQVEPKGVYKEIEVAKHNRAVEILHGSDASAKQQLIDSILLSPNDYNPPVLYALSRELFLQDKKEQAAFWFYVAQLRARYDANRCADKTATQGVIILNNTYGPDINKFAFTDLVFLESTVEKVVSFVKENEENYDPRWLNLHGMGAFINEKDAALSKPKETWAKIKTQTINDYHTGFKDYLKSVKK